MTRIAPVLPAVSNHAAKRGEGASMADADARQRFSRPQVAVIDAITKIPITNLIQEIL